MPTASNGITAWAATSSTAMPHRTRPCTTFSAVGTTTPAAAQSRHRTGPSSTSQAAFGQAVVAASCCTGRPVSAAPSAVPGPSPPQGTSDSASNAIAPAGAPAMPMARSVDRAKTAPTAKPVTLSRKAPPSSVATKIRRAEGATAARAGPSLVTAAWNSSPPATTRIGLSARKAPRAVSSARKAPAVAPAGRERIAPGSAAASAASTAGTGPARPETSSPTSSRNGAA